MAHNGNWVLQISYGKGRIRNSCSLKYNFSFQQDMKEMKKRICGINPCELISSLIVVYSALNTFQWMVYFSTIAALLYFLPKTAPLCISSVEASPLSICSHANATGGISQEECLNWWENKSAYNSFNQAADGCVMLEPVVLCVCMRLWKWRKVKQSWQPTLAVGFLFLCFLHN